MQFIEPSMLGVRSARLTLSSRDSPTVITLFPMVHVGERQFYDATYSDALDNDVVFVEGVRSPITLRITRSYRWLVGSRRMVGLILQPPFPRGEGLARIVHADLSPDEFAAEWRAVPLWLRAFVYVVAPSIGLYRRWFSTRSGLAKNMRCEDQPTFAELLAMTPETATLTQAILHARDARLVDRLRTELDAPQPGATRIAVVYGAAHMRAVVGALMTKHNFVVTGAEWKTIFSL